MADPQDRPDNPPGTTPPEQAPGAGITPPAPPAPPADPTPPPPENSPAKAVDKPAKKAPAKKAPAKAPKKEAAKKTAAKKTPAKKAPAKKAPAKKVPVTKAQPAAAPRMDTNGQLAEAAKDVAAHAKSTVESASNPVSGEAGLPSIARSPVPLAVAIAVSLLALLLVRQLRRRGS